MFQALRYLLRHRQGAIAQPDDRRFRQPIDRRTSTGDLCPDEVMNRDHDGTPPAGGQCCIYARPQAVRVHQRYLVRADESAEPDHRAGVAGEPIGDHEVERRYGHLDREVRWARDRDGDGPVSPQSIGELRDVTSDAAGGTSQHLQHAHRQDAVRVTSERKRRSSGA